MATRGTGYLLLKDYCLETTEFNGDMYPDGFGDFFYEEITLVKNEEDFTDFVNKFNKENFKYEEDLIYKKENTEFFDAITKDELTIDFNNNYFERFFSDWIFFKNLSGFPIRFITRDGQDKAKNAQSSGNIVDVMVPNGASYRFNFGYLKTE